MALSTARQIALFQILEVPYSPSVHRLVDADNLTALKYQTLNTEQQAYAVIMARLAALDSEVETVLSGYLDQWIALDLTGTRIEMGGVSSISGATYDPNLEERKIRERVLYLVPCYRQHEQLQNERGQSRFTPVVN